MEKDDNTYNIIKNIDFNNIDIEKNKSSIRSWKNGGKPSGSSTTSTPWFNRFYDSK